MNSYNWLIITLFLFFSPFFVNSLSITINQDTGINSRECLIGLRQCATINYAVKNVHVRQNVSIFLSSLKVTLSTVLTFNGWKGLKIYGQHYHNNDTITTIECSNYKGHSSGLFFDQSKDIYLYKFKLSHCSLMARFVYTNTQFRSGLVIQNCTDINLNHSQVTKSDGFGAVFMNNNGNVIISHSIFTDNALSTKYLHKIHGGSGALILSTKCSLKAQQCNNVTGGLTFSHYEIKHVQFTNNIYTARVGSDKNNCKWSLCYGGGLSIYLGWATSGHEIKLYKVKFYNNTASGGGGLGLTIIGRADFNKIRILNSNILSNKADGGGGGVKVSLLAGRYTEMNVLFNFVEFQKCNFTKNVAKYGGGTSLIIGSTDSLIKQYRKVSIVSFQDCLWLLNMAKTGGAVDVTQQPSQHAGTTFITEPEFINCHYLVNNRQYVTSRAIMKEGTFQITKARVHFKNYNIFAHNHATPLYLRSASVMFKNYTNIQFLHNKGEMGGAIALYDNSYIEYKGEATLNFTYNRATVKGGAIYASISDPHVTKSCFIKAYSKYAQNVTFYFKHNFHEGGQNNSIYLTTIHSCACACNHDDKTSTVIPLSPFKNGSKNCLGQFYFYGNLAGHVMTDVARIDSHNQTKIEIIPGRDTKMPVDFYDDLNNKVTQLTAYYVDFQTDHSKSSFAFFNNTKRPHLQSNLISNNHITVYAIPGKEGILELSTQGIRQNTLCLKYEILSCPPGYVLDYRNSCHCSAAMGRHYWYNGILGCNDTSYSVFIQPGYWIGYADSNSNIPNKEDLLYTGHCPPGYCQSIPNITNGRYHQIQSSANNKELSKAMCNTNRIGLFCSQCITGTSVYFHTYTHQCFKDTQLCTYGILFYVLSELLPITILFGICIYYNISFTSGTAYSLVFFIQQLNILYHKNSLNDSSQMHKAVAASHWFYSLFSLKFFISPKLSFCLWKGANAIDVQVMSYVSISYAIGLIYVLVFVTNRCCLGRKRQTSLIHGLTTFLVLCYSQVTQVTFNILEFQILRGKGNRHYPQTVPYWDGEMKYFHGRHLYYAVSALVFLFLIVIPTPLCLICDPLLLKLEGRLNVKSRHRFWTKFREHFKPLLDSFQSCFKDNYRSFAGIYFLYRMAVLLSLTASTRYAEYQFVMEILIIIMLVVQSLLQPFVSKRHNVFAILSFCGLLIVNILTIQINTIVNIHGLINLDAQLLQSAQVIILYIPLLVGFGWIGKFLFKWICMKKFHFQKKEIVHHQRSYSEISLIFDRRLEASSDYGAFKKR